MAFAAAVAPIATATARPSWAAGIAQTPVEIVTDGAETGDGGNGWGGHQSRIVRTARGVFTAYTVPGGGYLAREWRLVKRMGPGNWRIIAQGVSGREPVNLLAAPSGDLWVTAWPGGVGTIWRVTFAAGGAVAVRSARIPGAPKTDWPYGGAGIDARGNLCVVASDSGGDSPKAWFSVSCRSASKRSWVVRRQPVTYRHAYAFVVPTGHARLSISATRDVLWSTIGLEKPADRADYAFNSVGVWRGSVERTSALSKIDSVGEPQSDAFPAPVSRQLDAYRDTSGVLHVLYIQNGGRTNGRDVFHHRAIGRDGRVRYDVATPPSMGEYRRIFQDRRGNFYILGSAGRLARLSKDGSRVNGGLLELDLGGREVDFSGFGVSVPRTGSVRGDGIEVVFPSGTTWAYFRLRLP